MHTRFRLADGLADCPADCRADCRAGVFRHSRGILLARAPLAVLIVVLCLVAPSAGMRQPARADDAIRARERLQISIAGLLGEGVESRLTRVVEADGSVRLPKLDAGRLDAIGMTAAELEAAVARLYGQQVLAEAPLVVVSRLDAGEEHALNATSRPAGAGGHPSRFDIEGKIESLPAAMTRPIGRPVEFVEMPLAEVVSFLRDATQVPVWLNVQAIELEGVDRKTPISLTLPAEVSTERVLELVVRSAGGGFASLDYGWKDGVLVISTAEELARHVETVSIDIRPLIVIAEIPEAREEEIEQIIELITETVHSDTWKDNGGEVGSIRELNGRLVITAPQQVLRDIVDLLEKLAG